MSVNKFKILQDELDKYVNIPVELQWDFAGKDQAIDDYEKTIIKEVVGNAKDFEIVRFSHETTPQLFTDINYEFYFYNNQLPITSPLVNVTNWNTSYLTTGFNVQQIYYYENSFTKSFFKLDFYDTPNETTQKNYFSVIIPTQQGSTQIGILSLFVPPVNIKTPIFKLDFVGDKEGFFFYWLRENDYVNINKFFMSAKFFDARFGTFVRMTNRAQPIILPTKFTFDNSKYFYYEVTLNYTNFTYRINDILSSLKVGTAGQPIKWYEYVNP